MLEDVVDLELDDGFDVFIDHRGDLSSVKGRNAFEQRLIILIEEEFSGRIGEFERDTARDLLTLSAKRVAEQEDRIDSIAAIEATFPEDAINKAKVTIVYKTGDDVSFEVS